ncbi:hypothetical protein BJ508DRAFT_327437 [Ascobolus immersus RN42]|uniref:Uncharacterized protein n=1 Tax=Ascobolus immersus RN42 TaxID=1160509 RepID=A0A3N4I2K5_ASCIM|nr:hypothetical protein BJ508DRAFT_327437 [Ascobolus immersus RN42]
MEPNNANEQAGLVSQQENDAKDIPQTQSPSYNVFYLSESNLKHHLCHSQPAGTIAANNAKAPKKHHCSQQRESTQKTFIKQTRTFLTDDTLPRRPISHIKAEKPDDRHQPPIPPTKSFISLSSSLSPMFTKNTISDMKSSFAFPRAERIRCEPWPSNAGQDNSVAFPGVLRHEVVKAKIDALLAILRNTPLQPGSLNGWHPQLAESPSDQQTPSPQAGPAPTISSLAERARSSRDGTFYRNVARCHCFLDHEGQQSPPYGWNFWSCGNVLENFWWQQYRFAWSDHDRILHLQRLCDQLLGEESMVEPIQFGSLQNTDHEVPTQQEALAGTLEPTTHSSDYDLVPEHEGSQSGSEWTDITVEFVVPEWENKKKLITPSAAGDSLGSDDEGRTSVSNEEEEMSVLAPQADTSILSQITSEEPQDHDEITSEEPQDHDEITSEEPHHYPTEEEIRASIDTNLSYVRAVGTMPITQLYDDDIRGRCRQLDGFESEWIFTKKGDARRHLCVSFRTKEDMLKAVARGVYEPVALDERFPCRFWLEPARLQRTELHGKQQTGGLRPSSQLSKKGVSFHGTFYVHMKDVPADVWHDDLWEVLSAYRVRTIETLHSKNSHLHDFSVEVNTKEDQIELVKAWDGRHIMTSRISALYHC